MVGKNSNKRKVKMNQDIGLSNNVSKNDCKDKSYFGLITGLLIAILIPLVSFTYVTKVYLPNLLTEYIIDVDNPAKENEVTRFYTSYSKFDDSGYIDLLSGWTVTGFMVDRFYASDLTLEEMGVKKLKDYPESEYYDWFGPIYSYTQLQINNDADEINFIDTIIPTENLSKGILRTTINLDEKNIVYKVLVEPTKDTDGAIRILRADGKFMYNFIGLNPDYEIDGRKYFYIYKGCGMNYEGSFVNIEDVDQMFLQAAYNNDSHWCTTEMPVQDIN